MEHLLVFLCLAFPHFIHISGSHSSVEKANNEKAEHESLHVMPEPKAFPARRITLAINELNVENCTSYFINITYLNGTKANYTAFRINITDTGDKRLVLNGNNVTIHGNDTSGLIRVFVRSNGTTGGFSILILIASEVDGGKITIHPLCTPAFVGKHDKMGETGFYNFGILSGVESQPPLPPQLNIMSSAGELKSDLLYFSKGKYETSVAENEDPGTVLLIISAINTNTEDIYVFYKIIDQQPPTPLDAFSINSSTGHIVLLKTLDYAGNKYFDIVVEASVGNSSTLSSTANVRINVLEIRENCLKFSQAKYNVSVQENIPEGSIIYILNVTCRSKDGLFEGYFTVNSSMFRVERNAVIYLERGELDRERSPEIILEVWAFDGELSKLNSSAIVIVTLLDVNDNNPEFQNQTITFSILEGDYLTDSPVFLGEVEVEDLDVGLNGQINITSFYGGEDGRFIVLQNGTILVHGVLDRESKDRYLIPLMASDRGKPPRKSFAFALILIQDVNDNAPTFTQKEHFAHIVLADASYGDPVIIVSARDLDAENNSHILYRFPHEYSGFTINGQTGQICLSRNFSAITMDSAHSLLVIASDLGSPSLSSTVTVFVTVSMNNTDLGLQFADSFYSFTVPEDLSERSEVGAVHAITGKTKAPLTYLLITYSEIFSITDNGQILTRVVLDREDQEEYNVLVEATDSQEPPDTAAVTVTVTVTDVNDNTPVFSPMVHTYFTCQENKDRIDIGTMTATDLDTGNNGSVAYALGNDFNRIFHIDNSTGELTTTKALDRETASSYNVTVVAADMGTPPLSSTIVLHIAVGDLNDNPPVFSEKSFAITMKENEPPQVVLNVSAVDIDIGYNAVILYSFIKSAPLFYIGRHSGSISTLQSLDYESAKEYVLKVIAYNPSDPQHRGTATVIVTVEDVNEVAPRPQYPIYNRIIKDSASIAGLLVCDINATDEEGNVDQGLHYSVTDGNTGGLFAISNSTGHIFLIKGLPEQNSKVPYALTVMITDSGIPPLSAFVKVYITIIPNNTSSPVFSTDIYRPNPLSGQSLPTTFLVQVYALYSEPLRYNIVAGNDQDYFTMDPVTGVIITKKVLKKEDFPRNITVMAADPRDSDTFAEATVHVSLEEKNNATPSFPNNLVEVTVKEEQPSPLFITQLEATLNGTGRKEPLMYSLLNGSTKNFSINPTNGKLYAMTTFDYENGPIEYQIVLLAEDDGSAENNKGYCTVVIYILDINDWKPVFEPVENMVIVENALSGTIVGKVTATDRDTGNNAFIAYSLYDESNQFEIDRLLGNIFVKGRLDYETKNMSVLIVTATNNKTAPFYQTSKNVSVKILDQNDNAPKFTQKQYFAEFDANSPVGTRILVVNATDKDQGVNGDVEYFLIAESMPSNYFLVKNVKSGKIITSSSQLQPGLFNISVLAKDRGSPPLNDTASIIINIIHRPRSILGFNMNEISTTINRQEDGNHLVYTFAASNPEGKNIIYKIVAGNDLGLFTLDEKTGQLWTTDKLKYKTQPAYNITVAAIETPHLSSPLPVNMAQLEIFIRNATEELVFEKHLYKVKISNPVPFMFPVIRVKALELGEKYSIMYSLVNQTGNEFDINRNTGEIFIVSLNGKTGLYELKVQARDQAGLSDQTTVQVTVDSSSSSSGNAVEIKINQTSETVRRKLQGIVRILEDILHQNVSIKDLVTNYLEDNRSIETSIKFQALDKNDQAVDPATSAKKLSESKQSMQQKLENLFGQPVKISISEHRALMEGYGVLAASLMGALLGCVILVSSIIIWKRNKSRNGTSATRNMLDRNLENGHTGNHNGDPGDLEKGKKLKDPGNSEASQPVPPIPPIPPVPTIPSVKEVEQIEEEPSDLIPMEEDTSIRQTQNVAAKKKEEIVSKDEVTSESEEDTCQSAAFSKEGKTQTPVVSAEKIEGDLSKVQRTSDSQEDMFQSSAYSKEGCIPETTETQTWTKEQNGDEKEITVGEPFDLKITLPQIEEPEISEPCLIDDPPELEESKNKQLPEVVEETQVEYVETWESYESDDSEPDKITSKDMESETTENIPESAEQKQKIPDETEVTTQVTIMGRGSKSE